MSKQVNSIFIETIETEATKAISTIRSQGKPCWAPPLFPQKGRLALTKEQIRANHEKLTNKEKEKNDIQEIFNSLNSYINT